MKIIQIHNKYRYFGGEDSVVEEEIKLLRSHNHEVTQLIRENSKDLISFQDKFSAFKNISYSHKRVEILNKEFSKFGNPDIVHVHNIFPLWTYSIFDFFNKKNVPVIMEALNNNLNLITTNAWGPKGIIEKYDLGFVNIFDKKLDQTSDQFFKKIKRFFSDKYNKVYKYKLNRLLSKNNKVKEIYDF